MQRVPSFRIIDSGIREGRANIALDQAMIDLHRDGAIADTIRFLRFPRTALIGRHQALSHELELDYCRRKGIGVARRLTGGGAIYFDEGQLGWALVFHRASLQLDSLNTLTRRICDAAAKGLSSFGIDARYRPRNDIEVDGRKISGTGGFFDGDTLFFQGTVLVDMDWSEMCAALRVPVAKLAHHGLTSIKSRVVSLRELLGAQTPAVPAIQQALVDGFVEHLGIAAVPGELTPLEESAARRIYAEEVGTDAFVAEIDDPTSADVHSGTHTSKGGSITSYLRLEGPGQSRIREVVLTGDFFVTPPRITFDLEAALRGTERARIADTVETFFARTHFDSVSITADDIILSLKAALP